MPTEESCPERPLCKAWKAGGLLVFTQPLATFLVPGAPESLVPKTVWRESHSKLTLGPRHPFLPSHLLSNDTNSTLERKALS